jgi:hypothetical protein
MRRRVQALALGSAALVAVGSLSACQPPKVRSYAVTIEATSGALAPEATAGDTDVEIDITIENTSPDASTIGSANLIVPPVLSIVSAPDDTVAGGPAIELRNLSIGPGQSQTFPITVSVTSCLPEALPSFAVDPATTSDYSGTANRFTRDAGSDANVSIDGTCGVAFANAPRGYQIVGYSPVDTTDAPMAVEVVDAGGTDRATSSTASVKMDLLYGYATHPDGVQATSIVAAVDGLATFPVGPAAPWDGNFKLHATSSDLPGAAATTAAFEAFYPSQLE